MKKKILVLYGRFGSGHKSIAEYVANYIKSHNEEYEVKLVDFSLYGNWLGRVSVKVMDWVGTHRPEFIFNLCYEIMDHKISTLGHNRFAKTSYDNERLRKVIVGFNPDITISTHFYGSNMITYYNDLGLIKSKLFTIITDYRTHECWIRNKDKEDGYIVGNKVVKEELVKRGVNPSKVYPYGLPLNINKIRSLDKKEVIYKRYKIKGNKKVYLFFGGSSAGSMYYFDYFKCIAKMNLPVDIIFISGHNLKLQNKCNEFILENNIKNIKVLGYSNDVLNLMKISDLVISKPGGATVTECLEMRVPMLLIPGVGGQEKYNARFIVRKKFGLKVRGIWAFRNTLKKINANEMILTKIKTRLDRQDENEAVEKINELISRI